MRHSVSGVVLAAVLATSGCGGKVVKLVVGGESHELRKRAEGSPATSPSHAPVLVIAFDGIDRALLYDLLRKGELPKLAALLGSGPGPGAGEAPTFPHAYFDEALLSTLPSTTMAAWVTTFTGVGPAHHGVAGNEFFIREERRFAAPAPATFNDPQPTAAIYTEGYLNELAHAPSVYQRMRDADPDVLVWVAMQHFYAGADRLLVTRPSILVNAAEAYVEAALTELATNKGSRDVYERLDKEVTDVVVKALEQGPVPDVLTVYFSGTDLYAHVASEGPDVARRAYLREVLDAQLGRVGDALRARSALADRFVVVTSDHGHTQVLHDDQHALSTSGDRDPPALLKKAGFRVRPFKLEVPPQDDFQAVLAYQGAMAYVYLADRATCAREKESCDWSKPPRFEEDVLAVADAFYTNNADGALVPEIKGALDLVLTRRPRPQPADDLPFEVYVGGGKLVPVGEYLKEHPHPTYVDVESRLRDLAVGPYGERAGDVLLLAHNGDRDAPAERRYFAAPYHSWHGSPSRKDSEVPFIVARPTDSLEELRALTQRELGDHPHQQKVTDVLLALRRAPRRP